MSGPKLNYPEGLSSSLIYVGVTPIGHPYPFQVRHLYYLYLELDISYNICFSLLP